MLNIKDLTGQRFGRLVVLGLDKSKGGNPNRPGSYWFCRCDCGNELTVRGNSLKIGDTKSCGCLLKQPRMTKYLEGKRFGRLVVLERDLSKPFGRGNSSYWICQCDCGNKCTVGATNLTHGYTTSCGCLRVELLRNKNLKDITGNRFGKIVAIRRTENQQHGSYVWECKCDCGNICYYNTETLNAGHANSCGCAKSIGEANIEKIFKENKINFKKQFYFKDMTNRKYDFAILNENNEVISLIEFDGEQHYNSSSKFYTEEGVERDLQKNLYALNHNIPLYRIPYEYRDKMTYDLLFNNKFLVKQVNHYELKI
jgi:hypothetical protein